MARPKFAKPPRELLDAVVASLANGGGWAFDDIYAIHRPTGLEIWFPYDCSCVHIETKTHQYGDGYTPCGWVVSWRRHLVRAVCAAKAKRPVKDVLHSTIAGLYAS